MPRTSVFTAGFVIALCAVFSTTWLTNALAKAKPRAKQAAAAPQAEYQAETRLIAIYQLINLSKSREALALAQKLTTDFPNFHLGHLIHGDLLMMQGKPIQTMGDVPAAMNKNGATALAELREESVQRIKAIRDRPIPGTIPSQLLSLASRNKHVIAVDASKSRLYLLENNAQGMRLVADFYISVGKSGIGKYLEGDLKTPLGVYYLTTPIDPKLLAPLYGGGALPINYPNPFDLRQGRTGSGIWFHGTMPERYSRQPKSTDGCVVLANPDLRKLMAIVAVKTTPVVIASQLQWVTSQQLNPERQEFEAVHASWRAAKSAGQPNPLYAFYTQDFNNYGKSLNDWWPTVQKELAQASGKGFVWHETTLLSWRAEANSKSPPVMVVTYDEIIGKSKYAVTKRQYWLKTGNQWKIFFEGAIASS
jgi:L,D-transpeptidase YnhG